MNKKLLRIFGIISIPMMYACFFLVVKYVPQIRFSFDLLVIATIAFAYVSLHFFLDIKKMYEWIFKFRYLIGIAIFAFLVVGRYHGSSISFWNRYVNPDVEVRYGEPVLGIARGIRSDEWMVTTSANLSQFSDNVKLSNINSLINAKDNKVNLYPRLITKDLSMLLFPETLGFLFLPMENGYSFFYYLPIMLAFFVALELCMIITKKNKLYSTLGAFLLVVAPAVLWWNNFNFILLGSSALLVINKFINTKSIKIRALLAALLGYIATRYILIMYPAWMIPYAYLFGAIFIWMVIENKDKLKWKDLLYLLITLAVCAGTFLPLYLSNTDVFEVVSNTVYPGKREWYDTTNWRLVFTYMTDMFFPYIPMGNPCEYCQFLSLFPLPIIMGIYYFIKNKKKTGKIDWFILLTGAVAIFITLCCIFPMPKIVMKISFLILSTGDRSQLVIGCACIFLLIYILSRYESKKVKDTNPTDKILRVILASLATAVALWFSSSVINDAWPGLIGPYKNIISAVLFFPVFYLLLKNNKKTNFILFIMLMFINLVCTILILPMTKGFSVIYEKPFAKEIQKIVKEDADAKFLNVDGGILLQNYVLANGGKSINSTNFVPNLELWRKLDPEKKYNNVYNRYVHISTLLTSKQTEFELFQMDLMQLKLNYDDICITEADYLINTKPLKENPNYYSEYYHESNIYIYKTNCE